MGGQKYYLEGNGYAQVFSNRKFFDEINPIDRKSDSCISLESLFTEIGIPERITIDGSKEQNTPGT